MEFTEFPVNTYLYDKDLSLSWFDSFVKAFKTNKGVYIDLDGLAEISKATSTDVDDFISQRTTTLGITEDEYRTNHSDDEGDYRLVSISETSEFLFYLYDNSFNDAKTHLEYLSNKATKNIFK